LDKQWLFISPNAREFKQFIEKTFSQGLQSIQSIERWSKHDEFLPYANALEEWDQVIGGKWSTPDTYHLDPKPWLREDSFNNQFQPQLMKIVEKSFRTTYNALDEMNPLLNQYWRNTQTDFKKILHSKRVKDQAQIFTYVHDLFTYQIDKFERVIPTSLELGLFKIDLT